MAKRDKVRILSIDGGGIRGVMAQVLVFFEQRIQAAKGPDARLVDCIDMIVGTSTGAILGALLLVPCENGTNRALKCIAVLFLIGDFS